MNIEKLLIQRFEVIADYPNSIMKIGQIIESNKGLIYCDPEGDKYSDFPHLFKQLNWWDCRLISDMPTYIKSETKVVKPEWKMEEWKGKKYLRAYDTDAAKYNLSVYFNLELFKPTTEAEYMSFINKA